MLERARVVAPLIPWHIIQRGNNRSACFYTDESHVYLLLTLQYEDSASLLMKHPGQCYVQDD